MEWVKRHLFSHCVFNVMIKIKWIQVKYMNWVSCSLLWGAGVGVRDESLASTEGTLISHGTFQATVAGRRIVAQHVPPSSLQSVLQPFPHVDSPTDITGLVHMCGVCRTSLDPPEYKELWDIIIQTTASEYPTCQAVFGHILPDLPAYSYVTYKGSNFNLTHTNIQPEQIHQSQGDL